MTQLRKMMPEELERRYFAETTKECYILAVEDFARYFVTSSAHPIDLAPNTSGSFRPTSSP